jgi:SOS response regulatory protein OraA/RecX
MDAGPFVPRPRVNGVAARRIEQGQYHEAIARAGHLLAKRPLTKEELRRTLRGCGFNPSVIDRVVGRLKELGRLKSDGILVKAR